MAGLHEYVTLATVNSMGSALATTDGGMHQLLHCQSDAIWIHGYDMTMHTAAASTNQVTYVAYTQSAEEEEEVLTTEDR